MNRQKLLVSFVDTNDKHTENRHTHNTPIHKRHTITLSYIHTYNTYIYIYIQRETQTK